ncbi:MAG: hypothetical protein QXD70_00425 [Candidatus Bathyarchaeia archaeon]
MFKTKGLTCALLASAITMLLLITRPLPVRADPAITIYFEESAYNFDPGNATAGTLFNVTVWITSTEPFNLMMWQVYINYNHNFINITQDENATYLRAWPNDNMGGKNWDPEYVFYGQSGGAIGNPTYYASGLYGTAAIMLGDLVMSDVEITSFPKKLCTFEFNITMIDGPLTCELAINNDNTFIYNVSGEIAASKTDSTYTYVPEPILMILLIVMTASTGATVLFKKKIGKKQEH